MRGGSPDDGPELAAQFEALGVPAEQAAQWSPDEPSPTFAVLNAGRKALRLFLACDTQWRLGGMAGVPVGLDYAGVRAAADALRIRWSAALLGDLRAMELAASAEMAKRKPG